jgi:hypothetical protein
VTTYSLLNGPLPAHPAGNPGVPARQGTVSGMGDRHARLRARLVAVVMVMVCLAAAVTGVAGVALVRGYFRAQADAQLRAYAAELISDAFVIGPVFGGPKPASVPSDGISVEIIDPGGHRLARSGAGTTGVPVSQDWIKSHLGRVATVHSARGSWRVIVESVHYSAHQIPYVDGAADVSMVVSARTLPGLPGVVVVGMNLSDFARSADKFAVTELIVAVAVLLLLAWAGRRFIRAGRRPASPAPDPPLEQALVDAGEELNRSLRVVRGFGDYYRRARGLQAADIDRMVDRLAAETERMEAVTDALRQASQEP